MSEPYSAEFCLNPYKLFWKHPTDPNCPIERVYGEGYTLDRMLSFQEEIMAQLHLHPEGSPEIGIVGIMLYSDSTQLANFGEASLGPAYLTFANWSKYLHLKPSLLAMNHVIYFPSLPKTTQKHYQSHFNRMATDAELCFCKVGLLHTVWHLLLSDPRFVDAYKNGYKEECADGIIRLIFYQFFCYSANYVEKVMLACIKYLSMHPCALCLTQMKDVHFLGTRSDSHWRTTLACSDSNDVVASIKLARKKIFKKGYSVENQDHVQKRLKKISGLPMQSTFSKVFQPFGLNHYELYVPDSFHNLTGRISDFLKHNVHILSALKRKKQIKYLDQQYRQVLTFGNGTIRRFKSKVSQFTKFAGCDYQDALQCALPCFQGLFPPELNDLIQDFLFVFATYDSYHNLRQHTDSTIQSLRTATSELGDYLCWYLKPVASIKTKETDNEVRSHLKRDPGGDKEPRSKNFYMTNYKTHMLGHAADSIITYGTVNGMSIQAGEQEHRRVKNKYQITNKNKPEGQIASLVMVQHRVGRRAERSQPHCPGNHKQLLEADISSHHQFPQNLPVELDNVVKMSKADITLQARVIGIYHANVLYVGGTNPTKRRMRRMEFLFVWWFEFEEGYTWGWKMKHLPKVRFLDVKDPEAFGFVDPACVIWCSHVIPAFEWNDTTELLPSNSSARKYEEFHEGQYVKDEEDFLYYFINIFPDTDMFMRYRGGGIGHLEFHEHLRELERQARENNIPIPSYDENGDLKAHGDDDNESMGNSEVASELDEESDEEDLVEEETLDKMMTGWKFTYMDDNDGEGIVDDGADDKDVVDYEAESHSEDSGDEYN
ncbi:hypothetical protein PM082_022290 [Marasmius tenuissimus]|nr:hypothetical protein PM082_022290 [Marasmius tenuissimus]